MPEYSFKDNQRVAVAWREIYDLDNIKLKLGVGSIDTCYRYGLRIKNVSNDGNNQDYTFLGDNKKVIPIQDDKDIIFAFMDDADNIYLESGIMKKNDKEYEQDWPIPVLYSGLSPLPPLNGQNLLFEDILIDTLYPNSVSWKELNVKQFPNISKNKIESLEVDDYSIAYFGFVNQLKIIKLKDNQNVCEYAINHLAKLGGINISDIEQKEINNFMKEDVTMNTDSNFSICDFIEEILTGLDPITKTIKRKKIKNQLLANQEEINHRINSEFWEDGTIPNKKRVLEINSEIEKEKKK